MVAVPSTASFSLLLIIVTKACLWWLMYAWKIISTITSSISKEPNTHIIFSRIFFCLSRILKELLMGSIYRRHFLLHTTTGIRLYIIVLHKIQCCYLIA